jgi:hypothetical protein
MKKIRVLTVVILILLLAVVNKKRNDSSLLKKELMINLNSIKSSQKQSIENIENIGTIFIVPKTGNIVEVLNISHQEANEYTRCFQVETLEKGDTLFRVLINGSIKYFPYREEFFCLQ